MTMLRPDDLAPGFSLPNLDGTVHRLEPGRPTLLVFFEADCPTCHLTIPYLNRLALRMHGSADVIGVSQDGEMETGMIVERLAINFPVLVDRELRVSRVYDPVATPTLFLLDRNARIIRTQIAFDKKELNEIATTLCAESGIEPFVLAEPFDGAPQSKPGCTSRHQELAAASDGVLTSPAADVYTTRGSRASRI